MNKKEIKVIIAKQIAKEQEYQAEHTEVLAILNELNGKPINGRTLNEKRLGPNFKFVERYGMYHIQGKHSHLIGYHGNSFINAEKFLEWDACNGSAAKQREEQLKRMDIDKVAKLFGAIDKHWNELLNAFHEVEEQHLGSFHNPAYYELLRHIEGEEKKGSFSDKVKLSDMYYLRKPIKK